MIVYTRLEILENGQSCSVNESIHLIFLTISTAKYRYNGHDSHNIKCIRFAGNEGSMIFIRWCILIASIENLLFNWFLLHWFIARKGWWTIVNAIILKIFGNAKLSISWMAMNEFFTIYTFFLN